MPDTSESIFEQQRRTVVEQAYTTAAQMNAYVLGAYREGLSQWKQHHDWAAATNNPDRPKPQPPFSVMVLVGSNGWPELIVGPQMKDETPPDPPPAPSGLFAKLGPYAYQNIWSADPADNAPDGHILEEPGKGKFRKFHYGSPFGKRLDAYEKIG